jgi:hypothetical protein
MNINKVNKLYSHLNSRELAVLAFNAISTQDEPELDRILLAVPERSYTGTDLNYIMTLNSFMHVTHAWGLLYWQYQYASLAVRAGLYITSADDSMDDLAAREALESIKRRKALLLALDEALLCWCGEHRIDPAAVRRITGVIQENDSDALTGNVTTADPEALARFKESFFACCPKN